MTGSPKQEPRQNLPHDRLDTAGPPVVPTPRRPKFSIQKIEGSGTMPPINHSRAWSNLAAQWGSTMRLLSQEWQFPCLGSMLQRGSTQYAKDLVVCWNCLIEFLNSCLLH